MKCRRSGPSDRELLLPSLQKHQEQMGRVPEAVAADGAFYSAANEASAQALGGSAFPTTPPGARNGGDARSSAGSGKSSGGGQGVRGESVCSNAETDSTAVAIGASPVCNAGWVWG